MKKTILLLVAANLFLSCGDFLLHEDFRGGDWFWFENQGAIMPVWVRGNVLSETFIIILHGGPGGSAIAMGNVDVFKKLHEHYAIVYWDQRGSGISQGNANPDSFTMEQFVDDLERLVILIRYKYNNPSLFLMGHSWGVTLGTAFLTNPINQNHISGWIGVVGPHSIQDMVQHQIEWVFARAKEQIDLGKNVDYWEREFAWYNSNPSRLSVWGTDNFRRHRRNISSLNGVIFDPSNALETPFSWIFCSPYLFPHPSLQLNQHMLLTNNRLDWENINFTHEMRKITLPSLLLWGRHDGIVPVAVGSEAYTLIGSDNKYLYIFENSAHYPLVEEPELFLQKVRSFINRYRF